MMPIIQLNKKYNLISMRKKSFTKTMSTRQQTDLRDKKLTNPEEKRKDGVCCGIL